MNHRIQTLCLLALVLGSTAPSGSAQTAAPAATITATDAVDPATIQALKDMGAHLQSLPQDIVVNPPY